MDLESRVRELERRVADLENQTLGRPVRVEAAAIPSPVPPHPARLAKESVPVEFAPERGLSAPNVGIGSFLGVLAVFCFVLAGSYMVRLAIDAGLLTPERQILLAVIFGFSLIWTGLRLEKGNRHYAAYLPAAGVVVLQLACFGASMLYGIVAPRISILGSGIISLLCVALFSNFRTHFYAALACTGAYLVPFLLRVTEDPDFVGFYFVPISVTFAALSVLLRYRPFILFSGYLAIGLTNSVYGYADDPAFAAGLLGLHFFVFLLAIGVYSVKHRDPLTEGEAVAFTPLLLFFYGIEHMLLRRIVPEYVDWIALGFVGFLNLFHLSVVRRLEKLQLKSDVVVQAFSIIVVVHAFYLNIVPWKFKPLLFLFVLGAVAFTPARKRINGSISRLVEGGIFLLLVGNYVGVIIEQLSSRQEDFLLFNTYGVAYTLALLALAYRFRSETLFGIKEGVLFLLAAGHIQGVVTLYALVEDQGSLAVSGAWAAYALAILALGFSMKSAIFARSSLIVLMIAAGKAFLYDVSSAAPTVRILCLLLTGALLYGTGMLFQKIREWA